MNKQQLIDKYNRKWNQSKNEHMENRRKKHQATNETDKRDYEIMQYESSAANRFIGEFLHDLHHLNSE